jgi:hypothetical protein
MSRKVIKNDTIQTRKINRMVSAFYRIYRNNKKLVITTKVLIIIIVVAIVKIAVLILWRFRKSIS